jgi:hypothetical protein
MKSISLKSSNSNLQNSISSSIDILLPFYSKKSLTATLILRNFIYSTKLLLTIIKIYANLSKFSGSFLYKRDKYDSKKK